MGDDGDTITVDTIRRAAMKKRPSPAIDEVFYNKTSVQDAVVAVECGARREAVLWVAISSEGTIVGVCALHTVHGLPLEDLQQLKKNFEASVIDEEYERDCEIRIRKLKQDFNEWGSEVQKKEQAYEEEKYYASRPNLTSLTIEEPDNSPKYGGTSILTPTSSIEKTFVPIPIYLLYGSAGVRVITAAGGRSYKENSRFKRKVATVPAGRLCGSYWSAYGFFCLPCPILFVIAASIINKQYQPEDIQELMRKLLQDLQNISEELAEYINSPSWNRPAFYFNDDDDEYTIIYRSTKVITHNLPTEEPEDSLIMGDEHLSTIPEKESDEFIKSSVEDLVPIPSESEDTSDNESKCDVPVCDDSSPLDVSEDNPVIFSNPLFDSNEDFTSSDDESLFEEDVPKETFKIYSNPLFEFDDDFTSSDVNLVFNEVLEDVESEDSGDEIDAFLDLDISTEIENDFHDSEGDIIFLEKLLINNTFPNLPSEVVLDHDLRSLKDEPNFVDMVQVFDLGIHEKSFSPTFVKLTFEDRHYLPITFVIRIFLPYLAYSVDSPFRLSSGSEDTIFDPGISTFHFSYLKPMAYENPMVIFPFFYFCPKDKGIRRESS
ncbi:hypothetical protein Tco_1226714 [Tanacetum coccineum]